MSNWSRRGLLGLPIAVPFEMLSDEKMAFTKALRLPVIAWLKQSEI